VPTISTCRQYQEERRYGLFGVGGAALVASAVLFILEATAPEPAAAGSARHHPVSGGAAFVTSGRF